ncbi:hypothetical protein [Haloarcula salinisoli]|uniref:Uncharacterized protein n=1 Tax=Haloarcula salinisoli TaxID=2487746 RepID=A0A8J8CA64_9EURY|nr:hypothetical protein [Halomicroarcula salinisoli]MBX0285839.1 hypothetical protein [Halomicroarcula salinisoli]MBX0302668.1 hypothetical protein [Halomicroarcula salinisoli]
MVSRDTSVQVAAVVVATTLAVLSAQFGSPTAGTPLLLGAASYIVVFAGSHIYLALRGDSESVPVAARWRFAALVVTAVGAMVVGVTYRNVSVAGTGLGTVLGLGVAALFAGYWLYEAWDGYQASRRGA